MPRRLRDGFGDAYQALRSPLLVTGLEDHTERSRRAESLRPFSGCAARRRAPRRRPSVDGPAPRYPRNAGEGTSGPRRDAASRGRQFEKQTAGVPIGGGTDSPLTSRLLGGPTDPRKDRGPSEPEPPSWDMRRKFVFPGVRPRRSGPDVPSPATWRWRTRSPWELRSLR